MGTAASKLFLKSLPSLTPVILKVLFTRNPEERKPCVEEFLRLCCPFLSLQDLSGWQDWKEGALAWGSGDQTFCLGPVTGLLCDRKHPCLYNQMALLPVALLQGWGDVSFACG